MEYLPTSSNVTFVRKCQGAPQQLQHLISKVIFLIVMQKDLNSYVTQSQCDEAVKNFIIQGGHSFDTLKRPEFQNLIKALQPSKTVITYEEFQKGMDDDFLQICKNLKEVLSQFVTE